MDKYAVFGNPIKHSWSPMIHSMFAQQTGEALEYEKTLVPEDNFAVAVDTFFSAGGKGLNITVPFKQQAWQLAEIKSKRAQSCGAANTLLQGKNGKLYADNTDGVGLVNDIANNLSWQIKGKSILLIGAGGASRGVLQPLLAAQPAMLFIANRTAEKAQTLAEHFSCQGGGFDAIPEQAFDIIINASSASLDGEVPPLRDSVICVESCVYDMLYGARPTPFMLWAQAQGCEQLADGLGMLVEQAAEAFWIWRGVRPETSGVIEAVRSQL